MKTKEELNELKEGVENLNRKFAELTEDDLNQVVGGMKILQKNARCPFCGQKFEYLSPYHVQECLKNRFGKDNYEK